MRVTRISIERWRNLVDVSFSIPRDATLVSLVGENGTGKSNILELLSFAASRLGISQGAGGGRGTPDQENHAFEVEVELPPHAMEFVERATWPELEELRPLWDGRMTVKSEMLLGSGGTVSVVPGGMERSVLTDQFSSKVEAHFRAREETQHLYLDSDRSYPPFPVHPSMYGELIQQPWDSAEWTKQWSFRSAQTLYQEWIKYFIGREHRAATGLVAETRRAREAGEPDPIFDDHFTDYRQWLAAVLPHLRFVGVDSEAGGTRLAFDSAGSPLNFTQLSGGEREIAFLIGQIARFRLRTGLLLIDEPELHLNPDLVRTWLAFLRDTVEEGQVWVATHSLEAVEVSGPEAAFVMERTDESRLVNRVSSLEGRPVFSALSVAIGAPGFSISRLRFVFIEGSRETRERERFFALCGNASAYRFLEGGSCNEVAQRLAWVRDLAEETHEQLHVGGVIDRDFRTPDEVAELAQRAGVHVLGCHEIENMFLHPDALRIIGARLGQAEFDPQDRLRDAADAFAGVWILQHAAAQGPGLPRPNRAMRSETGRLTWEAINGDENGAVSSLVAAHGDLGAGAADGWRSGLLDSIRAYAGLRESDNLWRDCLGKQTLSRLARALGFSGSTVLERQVLQVWSDDDAPVPAALAELRGYVASLS